MTQMREFFHQGFICCVALNSMGHHCGYVGVPETHPWFGKSYTHKVRVPKEILERPISADNVGVMTMLCAPINADLEASELSIDLAIDVHGGVTFAGKDTARALWWFGFDCAHIDDGRREGDENWRDDAYAEAQCRRFADQLSAVGQWQVAE